MPLRSKRGGVCRKLHNLANGVLELLGKLHPLGIVRVNRHDVLHPLRLGGGV